MDLCFRLYFTLKKKADLLSVTVSPCAVPIEWSLAVRTLKDKPPKKAHCEFVCVYMYAYSWTCVCLKVYLCMHANTYLCVWGVLA